MAKLANGTALFFAITIFAIAASSSFSGVAFADDQDGKYSHSHVTALWDNSLVCGDHKCAHGEMPQHPKAVEPVRAH